MTEIGQVVYLFPLHRSITSLVLVESGSTEWE